MGTVRMENDAPPISGDGELESVRRELNLLDTNYRELLRRFEHEQSLHFRLLLDQLQLASLGEMVGNVAHQWRGPLNSIQLLVADLQQAYQFGELQEEYLERGCRRIMEQVRYMAETIELFRNYFRPDLKAVEFSIPEQVDRALDLVTVMMQKHQIAVDWRRPETDIRIVGRPREFNTVLLNLLTNARDALLARPDSDRRIRIRCASEGDQALLRIADNAGGVPEEIQARVFDPYFTTRGDQGTGVGLYMCRAVIEEHMGGRLVLRNVEDGAEFTIFHPLVPGSDAAPPTPMEHDGAS